MELQNRIIGIFGRKGSGKSTLARTILERCSRLFLFDVMGEHSWIPNTFDDLGDADEYLGWADMQSYFAGRFISQGNIQQEFEYICDIVFEQGKMLLAVEEVPLLCSASYLPESFGRIVRLGRHRRVSLLWTCQRLAEVSRTLTAMTDVFICFGTTEPRDLAALSDRLGDEIAQRVSRLPLHGWIAWDVVTRRELEPREVQNLGRTALTPIIGQQVTPGGFI